MGNTLLEYNQKNRNITGKMQNIYIANPVTFQETKFPLHKNNQIHDILPK